MGKAKVVTILKNGGGGIRTHEEDEPPAGFQDRCIQPLCHPTTAIVVADVTWFAIDVQARTIVLCTYAESTKTYRHPITSPCCTTELLDRDPSTPVPSVVVK